MAMYLELDARTFRQKLENVDDAVLIDVRTPEEIAEFSLDGHIVMNIADPSFTMKIDELDRDKSYFMYCRSGNRSGHACRYMLAQGFKKLYNLKGGVIEWQEEFE